jgi:hypothetical protein
LDPGGQAGVRGYRKDHIKPLACGGPDAVWNLQWQTVRDARIKDRWSGGLALASPANFARSANSITHPHPANA